MFYTNIKRIQIPLVFVPDLWIYYYYQSPTSNISNDSSRKRGGTSGKRLLTTFAYISVHFFVLFVFVLCHVYPIFCQFLWIVLCSLTFIYNSDESLVLKSRLLVYILLCNTSYLYNKIRLHYG